MRFIHTRSELQALGEELGVRPDWHEPDEQDVYAQVEGVTFDNAGFWPESPNGSLDVEQHVIIKVRDQPVAVVNLATLFAFACGTYEG